MKKKEKEKRTNIEKEGGEISNKEWQEKES
jgi:hypothetical protein